MNCTGQTHHTLTDGHCCT